jgi:hypothetical protein
MYSASYSCRILVKLEFSRQIVEKYSNAKFYKNPSTGEQVAPFRRTDGQQTDRQTDITKLTVAFQNFANAPNNNSSSTLLS